MKSLFSLTALAASLLTAGTALAAPAMVTGRLNLRAGPGAYYAVETAMPAGARVDVAGCMRGNTWCRVRWNGYEGWAASHYLAWPEGRGNRRPAPTAGAEIAIPLIAGAIIGGVLLGQHHDGHARRHDRHDHGRHRGWRRHERGAHHGREAFRHREDGRRQHR